MKSFKLRGRRRGAREEEEEEEEEERVEAVPVDAKERLRIERKRINERIEATNAKNAIRTEELLESAKREGGAVFEYDAVYDEMEKQRSDKHAWQRKTDGEQDRPKYMDNLLKNARERELQLEKARNTAARREIEEENKLLGKPAEVFVTSSYKKQLEETKQLEEQRARSDEQDQANDVTKKQSMNSFYSGVFHQLSSDQTRRSETPGSESRVEETLVETPVSDVQRDDQRAAGTSSSPHSPNSTSLKSADVDARQRPYQPGDGRHKRLERETSRRAPKSKLSAEDVEAARQRALERFRGRNLGKALST